MAVRFTLHPWHGIDPGPHTPALVTAYIEITPSDTVKYELDKHSGLLQVDRPQLYSNVVPALYGFIPGTYCDDAVAALCQQATGRSDIRGDGDPLDILVLTEHRITQGHILVRAIPVGGFRMIDHQEADDKIIAVLEQDSVYGGYTEMHQLPLSVLNRLEHYFLTYKRNPEGYQPVSIPQVYGRAEAHEVIQASILDYKTTFVENKDS